MVLLNSSPHQSFLLTINKPLTLWIGAYEATVKIRNKKSNYVIFSQITADLDSEILIDANKEIFWRKQFSALGWFPARIYNIALNPSRYATISPENEESIIWKIMPFEYCLSNGLISIKNQPPPRQIIIAKKTPMLSDECERLLESADLLTTAVSREELQWINQQRFF